MPQRPSHHDPAHRWNQSRISLRSEWVGAIIALAGLLLLALTLLYRPESGDAPPFLTVVAGWTAPLMALSLVIVGGVLALRQRAGYWSAEALLGAELLLVGLAATTYVLAHHAANWNLRMDGADGGLIGWALGNLLLSSVGHIFGAILAISVVVAGAVLLVRYTPLIYPAAAAGRMAPAIPALGRSLKHLLLPPPDDDTPLPQTPNFVTPVNAMRPGTATPPASVVPVTPITPANAPTPVKTTAAAGAAPATGKTGKKPAPAKSQSAPVAPAHTGPATTPPTSLLVPDSGGYTNANVVQLEQIILRTLEDFNVPARIVHVESGPTVTQFGVEPLYVERAGQKRKVRVNRIVSLSNDLALALAAPAVRIEAPVPGRPYVGIEVPNPDKSLVSLRGIVESPEMRKGGALALPLGRNTAGAAVVMDLTRAPHLLIAGATGSGKSVCINSVVTGLLMQHGPETLRFIMVDPKMVELPGYNGIPHLYGKVITDVEQVMGALTWLLLQMDDRYQLFRDLNVRNIDAYNTIMRKQKSGQPLPYLVLVIDELADLMMTAAEDIERQICRLAQMARATGIHLVLATQRPSTDVITGLIKANFPTRISFAVTSQIDSRVILDTPGAESLLGRGDMLLMRPDLGKLTRLQGCFVADDEINRVVDFWKQQTATQPATAIPPWNSMMDRLGDDEELIQDATDVLRGMQTCSTSMLQRRMGLGYPKAARLMEELEKRGIVGPDLGAGRGRAVRLKADDEDELFDDANV